MRASSRALGVLLSVLLGFGLILATRAPALEGSPAAKIDQRGGRPALEAFRSCDQLRGFLREHRRALPLPFADEFRSSDAGGGAVPDAAAPASEPGPTPTNVQEQGVDEPDIVKADGSVILALAGERLRAVDVSGEEPRLLDSMIVPEGPGEDPYLSGSEMLVAGERALVIVRAETGVQRTVITEVDLSDPGNLRPVRTLTAAGNYVSARLHGETARVVISAYPELPAAEGGRGRAWMPSATLRDRPARERTRRRLLGCRDVMRPRRFAGAGLLSVLTIDLARGLPAVDVDAVMTEGEIAYASPTSLYVATQRWLGWAAAEDRVADVSTSIHRFEIADPQTTEYAASGSVPGFMLSQWSMSEHEGLLRVASTTMPPWRGDATRASESIVSVLAQDSERLVEVGSVGGLGKDESIYAVRFIGEIGYVVTFRQIDPLYVVDLSDPSSPRVRGELKVPGYSAYLHPVADGRLLGVGQAATEEGRLLGSQLSLFDVSNLDAPARLDREELGRHSRSEVELNHRAFLFSAPEGLGVMPLTVPGEEGEDRFFGAAAFRIAAGNEIEAVTRLAHGDSREERIRRALIVGDRLYTLSAAGVMAHDLATLAREAYLRY